MHKRLASAGPLRVRERTLHVTRSATTAGSLHGAADYLEP